jgi:UDP-glucose 4-epimerase
MKILVTGGSGFVGSHLTEHLLDLGHEVIVYDDFSTGNIKNLNDFHRNKLLSIVEGSVLDISRLEKNCQDIDYIFHLAAAVGVFNIMENPIDSIKINIQGTSNLLEIANAKSIPFFLTSTSEVYGKNNLEKLNENSDRVIGPPSILRWAYSEAKALDESLTYAYWYEKKLPIRIVRLFNTVGPRQSAEYGMVIPRFIRSALTGMPITIFGDGNQMRCFTHILDVIDGIIRVAFNPDTVGKTYNIGNPTEVTISQLANKIMDYSKSNSEITFSDYKDIYGPSYEDMTRRLPDISEISRLGWEPKRNLDHIIKELIDISRNKS